MSRRLEGNSVLFINRMVAPAPGATGQLLAELASELNSSGWQVSVLAPHPNRNLNPNLLRRAFAYLLLYPQLLWRALCLPRHHVVVTMTDPPLLVALGALVSMLKGCSHIHWAQDLYPELAEELGVLRKGGVLANFLRQLSAWCMKHAYCVVAIGDCMKQRLIERGIPSEKVTVVPNWGICGAQAEDVRQFRKECGFDDRFVVMYSGNLGLAHCFESILEAAEGLQREPNILFVFVGAGSRLSWIQQQVRERKIQNVRFLPPQPQQRLAATLAAADLHLASMREELCGLVVPSKVYGALAAGRPCFFIGPEASEAAQVVLRHNVGCVFDVRDSAALAGSIARWARGGALLRQFNNALQSIAPQFCVAPAAEALASVLDAAASQNVNFGSNRREEVADLFTRSLNPPKVSNLLTSVATDPKS